MLEAKNINNEAIEKMITVWEKTFTRPYLSAKIPKIIPPTNIPRLVMVEIKPACVPVIPKVVIMVDKEKDKNIISMFSRAIPAEVETSTLR